MVNFIYNAPTKVVFGKGTECQVGELVKEQKATKVLVHFGGESARKSGLIDRVAASLQEAGIPYVELGGAQPNPRLALVYEGIELCKKEGVDFIVAVGGGSVIDSAKAIGYGAAGEGDVWDFYEMKRKPTAIVPVGAVVTLAAAGSEMSNSTVITNEAEGKKRGLNTELGRCKFAVMNPELTLTLPAYQTACGAADILMHTMERYFTNEKTMEITDGIAEALLRTVIHNAQVLTRDQQNYEARAEMMWAGALSHNGLTSAGGGLGDWSCHQMGHEISAMFDLAHGASLTLLWGSWARYVYKEDPARFARFATHVLELAEEGDEEEMALAGIEEMESFFWGLELPTSFADIDKHLTPEELQTLASGCSRGGTRTVGAFKKLDEKDMLAIYKMANETEG